MRVVLVSIMVLITLSIGQIFAQTEVEGNIRGVWNVEGSPYIVVDDVEIRRGDELVIEPGVVVRFERPNCMWVHGLLTAVGTEEDSIIFTRDRVGRRWRGIRIENADNDTEISYSVIEYAETIGQFDDIEARGAGIACFNTDALFSHNTIRFNRSAGRTAGIYTDNCDADILHNHVYDNFADTNAAVEAINSNANISHNIVENNESQHGGGMIFYEGAPTVEYNIVRFNDSTVMDWGCGLYFAWGCRAEVRYNIVVDNIGGGVYVGAGSEIDVFEHNTIANNPGTCGILSYGGQGGASINLRNSIVWGHDVSIWLHSGGRGSASYSLIEDINRQEIEEGEGVFDEDPRFIDENEGDYNIGDDSPCVDAGDPDSPRDLDDSIADVGALSLSLVDGETDMFVDPDFIEVDEPGEYVFNITNEGENRLLWQSSCNVDWITCDPDRALLEPDNDIDVIVEITDEGLNDGVNRGEIIILSNDRNDPEFRIPVLLSIGNIRELRMSLNEAWNYVSMNIIPGDNFWDREDGPSVVWLFNQLRLEGDDHHIIQIKDDVGRFWSPQFRFNNIPYWNLTEGYMLNVDEDIEASWEGEIIPFDDDVPLTEGWNLAAYFPRYELSADAPDFVVLSNIIDDVVIAKDDFGNFLSTEFEFSNMEPWRETRGYLVKVERDVILSYPPEVEDRGEMAASQSIIWQHWDPPQATGQNMSLLLKTHDLDEVCEIAAFNPSGTIIGLGKPNNEGLCGIALWGDDTSTQDYEGLRSGEKPQFKLWDGFCEYSVKIKSIKGDLCYESDGFSYGELIWDQPDIVRDFILQTPYPNPFNSVTSIKFALPVDDLIRLAIYNVGGEEIARLIHGEVNAGYHSVAWNASDAPSGVYFAKLYGNTGVKTTKLMLIK